MMKSFQTVALFFLICVPILASNPGDSAAVNVGDESFSFKRDAALGVGLFAGPFSGAWVSLRFYGSIIGSQFTGYFVTSGKGESSGSAGYQVLIPIKSYDHFRFMGTAGVAYFSDADSKFRFGAGVISEWLNWSRLGLSLGLDIITIYDDGTILVPFVSGGLHIYF